MMKAVLIVLAVCASFSNIFSSPNLLWAKLFAPRGYFSECQSSLNYAILQFDGAINTGYYSINAQSIDTLIPLNNDRSWRSGFGVIGDVIWNPESTILKIGLDYTISPPRVFSGDTVSFTSTGNKVIITADWEYCFRDFPGVEINNKSSQIAFEITPNPFKTITTIHFYNAKGDVRIGMYSSDGKKIESFAYFNKNNLLWDASKYAPGDYVVKLLNGNNTYLKRVCLLK